MTTIRQLAEIAGVSSATVSMALRNHPRISSATRQRIQDLAATYHYRKAPSLLYADEAQRGTIGCILPEISRLFFSRTLAGILDAAFAADYHVVTLPGHWDLREITRAVDMLVARGITGLLIYPGLLRAHGTHYPAELSIALLSQGIPVVFLSNVHLSHAIDRVTMNEEQCGQIIVEHLFMLGHRRIAHLGAICDHPRQRAFAATAEHYGMEAQFIEISPGSRITEILANTYQQHPLPTAFVGFDDYYAAEAIRFVQHRGLRVPRDVSITGCSNCMLPTEPDLTTIEQFPEEMGRSATSLLLQRLHDLQVAAQYEPTTLKIAPQLVIGHSCAPPPRMVHTLPSTSRNQHIVYTRLKQSARFSLRAEDTEATVTQRYQVETVPALRRRWQALLLLRQGLSRSVVARIVDVHPRTLCDWLAWYQSGGLDAVASHRRGGLPTVHRRLSETHCEILRIKARQGEFSTISQACDWVESTFQVSYTIGGMRKLLARLRSTEHTPPLA
ncbi:MAG: substrate-binding domain-containing protein [Armatimonadota bacterium]